jgi:hypothetical protein
MRSGLAQNALERIVGADCATRESTEGNLFVSVYLAYISKYLSIYY